MGLSASHVKSKISEILTEERKDVLKKKLSSCYNKAAVYTELALLSREEFDDQIKELNSILKESCKSSPVRVCFLASCSAQHFNWKVLTKVGCFKIFADGSIIMSRLLTVVQFWKLRNEILQQVKTRFANEKLDEFQFVDVNEEAGEEEFQGSAECRSQHQMLRSLSTSAVFASAEAVSSEEMECCICMDRTSDVSLPCAHCFCKQCTMSWSEVQGQAQRSCPICRQQFGPCDEFWEMANAPDDKELQSHLISLASGI